MKHGADPRNYVGDVGEGLGSTLLHHLTIFGREGAMRAVLESGTTAVNIPNSHGKTAIFYASSPGIVDLLFNAGFSVEWEDLEGFRPIHGMIARGDTFPRIVLSSSFLSSSSPPPVPLASLPSLPSPSHCTFPRIILRID